MVREVGQMLHYIGAWVTFLMFEVLTVLSLHAEAGFQEKPSQETATQASFAGDKSQSRKFKQSSETSPPMCPK
jgi:hypothetical protein